MVEIIGWRESPQVSATILRKVEGAKGVVSYEYIERSLNRHGRLG